MGEGRGSQLKQRGRVLIQLWFFSLPLLCSIWIHLLHHLSKEQETDCWGLVKPTWTGSLLHSHPLPLFSFKAFCWFTSNPCHPTTLLVHLIDVFSLFWFTTIVLTLPLFYASWVQRSRTVKIQSKKLNWWGGWSEFRLKLSRNHLS